jgi:hypothetical protein
MDNEQLRVLIGGGGWLRVAVMSLRPGSLGALDDTAVGAAVRARAEIGADGRVTIVELRYSATHGLTNDVQRRFPFPRLEWAVNLPSLVEALAASIGRGRGPGDPVPIPPPDELARPLGAHTWVFDNGTVAADIPLQSRSADLVLRPLPESKPRLRDLKRWTGRRPDEFYRQVARVFAAAAAAEPRPAVRIAEANRVPVTTVHRWIKEARRRGLTPPSRAPGGAQP